MMETNAVDAMYRAKEGGVDFQTSTGTLKSVVENLTKIPLIAQPGKAWNYSVSTDVLGYLVEVISGVPFEKYLLEKVIKPLGMIDTDFHVPAEKHERFAANYSADTGGKLKLLDDPGKSRYLAPRTVNSGGGGLVSTASDYLRFCKFMLNKGELDGVRLLGQEDGRADDVQSPERRHGRHGRAALLGVDLSRHRLWPGLLGHARSRQGADPGHCRRIRLGRRRLDRLLCDPAEDMAVVMMTQLMPSSTYPIRRELRVLSYQAIVD